LFWEIGMARASRAAAVLPVFGAVMAAMALTSAAVFTVADSGCSDAGRYVQHGQQVTLVGGCVQGSDLPPHVGRLGVKQ
jgi:hypothetical protein